MTRPADPVRRALLMALAAPLVAARAAPPVQAECIAPARPGGGFETTCRLAQALVRDVRPAMELRVTFMPGGIGALAFQAMTTRRAADAGALVAFSSGTLLNLAQGKFGPHGPDDVRWVAAFGLDHGVITVHRDSPLRTLADLAQALKADPNRIAFGAGGTIGSQDWIKTALVAQAAGIGHKAVRYVAFEGGGDALTALAGGHVQVVSGDAGETVAQMAAGAPLRILAVLAERRLEGPLASVPTAREQGMELLWPALRGVYVGPRVGDADYRDWVDLFAQALARPESASRQREAGLEPLALTGEALEQRVRREVESYRALAARFGLGRR